MSLKREGHSTSNHLSTQPSICLLDSANLKTKLELTLPSKIEAIAPAVKRIMGLLRKECCAPEHEFAVETALQEALANAILHGNRQDPTKKVHVCCACDSAQGVLIVVQDEGEGFDPSKVPSPILAETIHSEGGRGIYLINAHGRSLSPPRRHRNLHAQGWGRAAQRPPASCRLAS